jgi:hypothetical protein
LGAGRQDSSAAIALRRVGKSQAFSPEFPLFCCHVFHDQQIQENLEILFDAFLETQQTARAAYAYSPNRAAVPIEQIPCRRKILTRDDARKTEMWSGLRELVRPQHALEPTLLQ